MNFKRIISFATLIFAVTTTALFAYYPKKSEMNIQRQWVYEYVAKDSLKMPFSFLYNGKHSLVMNRWDKNFSKKIIDNNRTMFTKTYLDYKTGLQVRYEATIYSDYPVVEYQMFLKNTSKSNTPIIKDVKSMDISFDTYNNPILYRQCGDDLGPYSYEPAKTYLSNKTNISFIPESGRGTSREAPYYNLQTAANSGVIIIGGWPGEWKSDFGYRNDKVYIGFGVNKTNFYLMPDEEIYAPRMVLLFWAGCDWIDSQNVWRRWMMDYNMPRVNGKLPEPMLLASSSRAYMEMINANEDNQKMFIDRYQEEGIDLDYWWMDAAWYANEIPNPGMWPIGSYYEPDPVKFPNGFAPISDYARDKYGMKTVLWFEPENVWPQTKLANERPEWLFSAKDNPIFMLNMGINEARKWRTNIITNQLKNGHISIFRQDFNMNPTDYWRCNEDPDRIGLNEIKHTMGYLKMWDDIRAELPNIWIDSCASGGRRNEIEALKRSIVLWRSDTAYNSIINQNMTYGLSLWIPFAGTGTAGGSNASYYGAGGTLIEPYAFWSDATISLVINLDMRDRETDYSLLAKLVEKWRMINHLYYGDFYPLTSFTVSDEDCVAYQYNSPEKGEGVIFAFRRENSFEKSLIIKPRGLDKKANYRFTFLENGGEKIVEGKKTMEEGYKIEFVQKPEAVVIKYKVENK